MNIRKTENNGESAAIVDSAEVLITDVQSALDFFMSVHYETGCHRIALNKEAFADDFFVLRTRLAGDILQKAVNYQFKLAIYGDFSGYTSKALKDFIYESNNGKDIFFVLTAEDAQKRLLAL